jgi:hypothetical protein
MFRSLILIFSLAICLHTAVAQEAENVSFTFEKGLIVVRYDFHKGDPDETYEFFLYSSHDNFTKPLQMVSGDVGPGIGTGGQKTIYWDAKAEMGNFKGNVKLKVLGSLYKPLVVFENTFVEGKVKRGKQMVIQWTSAFDDDEKLKLEIVRFNSSLQDFDIRNEGTFSWDVPKKMKTGDGYTVRISQRDNPLKHEVSAPFRIRPKIPLGIKLLPAAVAAGAAAIVVGMGGEDASIEGPPPLPSKP